MRMLAEVEADLGAMLLGAHPRAGFSLPGNLVKAPGPLSSRFPQLTSTLGAREELLPARNVLGKENAHEYGGCFSVSGTDPLRLLRFEPLRV